MTAEKVVRGRFRFEPDDAGLVMATMREARRRTGMDRETFAGAVNARAGRPLQLGEGSIEAYEVAFALPTTDVFLIALDLGGLDLRRILSHFVYG